MSTTICWGTAVFIGAMAGTAFLAQRELAETREQAAVLHAHGQDVLERIEIKRSIVKDVIEGRVSLREAAARFAEVNAICPTHLNMLRRAFPGLADEEVMCRNVMSFVGTELRAQPEEAARVLERLEKELSDPPLNASARPR